MYALLQKRELARYLVYLVGPERADRYAGDGWNVVELSEPSVGYERHRNVFSFRLFKQFEKVVKVPAVHTYLRKPAVEPRVPVRAGLNVELELHPILAHRVQHACARRVRSLRHHLALADLEVAPPHYDLLYVFHLSVCCGADGIQTRETSRVRSGRSGQTELRPLLKNID